MKISYEIVEDNTIIRLGEAPKNDMDDALKIVYGEDQPFDAGIVHIPALVCSVVAGQIDYPLPPVGMFEEFSVDKIREVELDDRCLDIVRK